MLMVGFALGVAWGVREARRRGMSPDLIIDYALWALISSIVCARLVYVLLNLDYYLHAPVNMVLIARGGLSFHGGFGGAILALYIFARRRNVSFAQLLDVLAPSVPLGYACARIGCFLNGCCHGIPTDLPWACQFIDPDHNGVLTPPVHPVQFYASALSLALFGILVWKRHSARFDGEVLLWYVGGYAVVRFGLEYLRRGVTGAVLALGLTQAQFASIAMACLALVGVYVGRRRARVMDPDRPHDRPRRSGRDGDG
jgi:phosphatidylglycerol:prolipoprotein diacylglycerol transferase